LHESHPPGTVTAAVSEKENVGLVHSLRSFLMEMSALRTDNTHSRTQCEVGSRLQSTKGKLTSENSLRKALGYYTSLGETANEKARGPGPKLFLLFLSLSLSRSLSPFQGKMPRAIKIASSE